MIKNRSDMIGWLTCVLVAGAFFAFLGLVPRSTAVAMMSGCTFESAQDGDWSTASTWTDNTQGGCGHDYPQSGDTATVHDEVAVDIAATCDTLLLDGDGDLDIEGSQSLTIESDSDACGIIRGSGTLAGGAGSPVLTLFATQLADPARIQESVTVDVKLVNNGTVVADSGTLTLSDEDKSGSGVWKANGGILSVEAEVTGSATWRVVSGEISIETPLNTPSLTGDVLVEDGTFTANKSFKTCGDLAFSGGTISCATGAWLEISGDYVFD